MPLNSMFTNSFGEYDMSPINADPVGKTAVDARITGYQFMLCAFAGDQEDSDGRRYCKHFRRASFEPRCMYYRSNITDREKTDGAARELCICDFKE